MNIDVGMEAEVKHLSFTWWQDGEFFIGFFNDFPDYQTQGFSLEELQENLKSIYKDIEKEEIPYIRHTENLAIN